MNRIAQIVVGLGRATTGFLCGMAVGSSDSPPVSGEAGPAGATGATGAQGAAGVQGPAGVVSATAPLLYSSGSQELSLNLDGVDHIGGLGYLQFDTTASGSNAPGRLLWNDADGTLNLQGKNAGITYQLGQESAQLVRNETGSTIPNGSVYVQVEPNIQPPIGGDCYVPDASGGPGVYAWWNTSGNRWVQVCDY